MCSFQHASQLRQFLYLFAAQSVLKEEANLKQKKISVSSPIGKGLLGKTVGEVAEIKVPAGMLKLEVIGISR